MSKRIHIAAAAKQLNRKLFNNLPIEGIVVAGHDNLEVTVHGAWENTKVESFAGYTVAWQEIRAA
jgi:protein-L-isoaspartate O-methyltransferase